MLKNNLTNIQITSNFLPRKEDVSELSSSLPEKVYYTQTQKKKIFNCLKSI